jgi:hypothetical protein
MSPPAVVAVTMSPPALLSGTEPVSVPLLLRVAALAMSVAALIQAAETMRAGALMPVMETMPVAVAVVVAVAVMVTVTPGRMTSHSGSPRALSTTPLARQKAEAPQLAAHSRALGQEATQVRRPAERSREVAPPRSAAP